MPEIISQVQFKRSDKTLANLSTQKLKYGEPILLTNSNNKALVIGNSSENDTIASDYFIPIGTKEDIDKGYMVKGVDYVTAGKKTDTSLGTDATAEGNDVTASGDYSHSEGYNTVANHKSQHVFGEYNTPDDSLEDPTNRGNYIEIVGNGTASDSLSNARTLDWSGNETLSGKLTLGAAPTASMDAATKKYVDDAVSSTSQGTVTSVRVQATSPVQSSSSTAATTTLDTTISLADNYGDTKNPYASKTKNYVLASPSNAAGVPSFRALVASDIPSHNHATSDITSGILSVSRGGTGRDSLTSNAVLTGNSTNSVNMVATANGSLTFGILPAAQGGTGNTSLQATRNAMGLGNTTGALPVANGGTGVSAFTANCIIMSNNTTTGALVTRAVTNNTSSIALVPDATIPTQNTVYYGLTNRLNRSTALNASDGNYSTCMARGESLHNTETNPSVNGAIAWNYE